MINYYLNKLNQNKLNEPIKIEHLHHAQHGAYQKSETTFIIDFNDSEDHQMAHNAANIDLLNTVR